MDDTAERTETAVRGETGDFADATALGATDAFELGVNVESGVCAERAVAALKEVFADTAAAAVIAVFADADDLALIGEAGDTIICPEVLLGSLARSPSDPPVDKDDRLSEPGR